MKLFCVSDIHSYFTPLKNALDEKGFEPGNPEHLLICCGDCFDRGPESDKVYEFLNNLTNVVLVRGNHEDLLVEMLNRGYCERHDHSNGTTRTVIDLVDITGKYAVSSEECCEAVKELIAPFINKFVNYFETDHYIFVHGWIPCDVGKQSRPWYQHGRKLQYNPDWRTCSNEEWEAARWINGIDAGFVKKERVLEPGKTIVCGHWHCSYGHYWKAVRKAIEAGDTIFEANASEFGETACFEPFEAEGILAIDACTAHTGKINVVVLEDNLLYEFEA